MVSYQNYQVRHVPIADAVNRLRLVPPHGEMVQTARDVEFHSEIKFQIPIPKPQGNV